MVLVLSSREQAPGFCLRCSSSLLSSVPNQPLAAGIVLEVALVTRPGARKGRGQLVGHRSNRLFRSPAGRGGCVGVWWCCCWWREGAWLRLADGCSLLPGLPWLPLASSGLGGGRYGDSPWSALEMLGRVVGEGSTSSLSLCPRSFGMPEATL